MSEIQSCELSLIIKQLKLSVKFPCKLTFQHAGKALTSQISSNATNVFSVNKDVTVKEERPKDAIQININLATEKGGNIMAGIIKINLKDISSSEGQNITLSLQKCLDSYATCTIFVKSARLNKSRIKTFNHNDDKRGKYLQDSKFQTKSQAPIMDGIKSRPRYNEAQNLMSKKIAIANMHSPTQGYLKQKALSTVGFKIKDLSFDRQELGSRFKHLSRKGQEEDSKTVVTGRWKDTDQMLKATIQANQKSLKMQIAKYKTKYEQSQRNIDQKQKIIKQYKDQVSDLNRQVTQKTFLLQQIATKNNHISKLQQINKTLSKQLHQDRNKVIDLQRDIQQQRNNYENKLVKMKQDMDKKQYDLQKQIYQRKEQTKQALQDGQYKAAQIKKMKVLIEDLERSLQTKTVQWQRMISNEKAEHLKTKNTHQNKLIQISSKLEAQIGENQALNHSIKVGSEAIQKLQSKNHHLEDSLKQIQEKYENEVVLKEKIIEEKKILQKNQEQLLTKLKFIQKEANLKQKQHTQLLNQLNQVNAQNKKKIVEQLEKSKLSATKIQQLENKCNILTASEQKLKRNLEICQKDLKNSQQNEKSILRNMKAKEERILQLQKEISQADNKTIMKETLSKKDMEYKTTQIQKLNLKLSELQKSFEREKEENEERRLQLLKNQNKLKMLEEGNNRLSEQIKELKSFWAKREDQFTSNIAELNNEIKKLESKQAQFNRDVHSFQMEKMNLKNQISKLQRSIEAINEKYEKSRRRESQLESTVKNLSIELEQRNQQIIIVQSDFKILQNDYKMLQADKSKHEKITTIISEEKDTIKNDVSKLKKEIQRKDQKQQQYLQQIKGYKETITKIQLKLSTVTKEAEKFKNNITQSLKSAMVLKQNYITVDNISHTNLELSRSIQRSRIVKNQNNDFSLGVEQSRFGEIIQNISKESQQNIAILSDDLRKTRKQKQSLEREVSSLTIRLKETQQQLSKSIKDLNSQIQSIVTRANEDAEDYEQKISQLQKQLQRKEKVINQMVNQVQDITKIHENERSNQDISISDLLNKVQSLKYKIVDLQRKDQSNSQVFISLEEKITELEQQNFELQHQLQMYSQQLAKKERIIATKSEQVEELIEEIQKLKRLKNEQSVELMAIKQSLSVQKENAYRLSNQLKVEQQKNQQLKLFQSQILKQKQSFLKKQFEKSEKIYSLEQNIQASKSQYSQKIEEINIKTKIITEQKETLKQQQSEINNIQLIIGQLRINLQKEKERVKDRQRKIVEKDSQIENIHSQLKKNTLKNDGHLKKLQQQLQSLSIKYSRDQSAWTLKNHEHQNQIKNLKESEKRQSQNNISLEQLIFFERQTNNLHLSKIEQLKQQISELQMDNNRLNNEIIMLVDEVKQKEENLFALSGKLYASDNRIDAKEQQLRQRQQKIQQQWRCKLQEICQEYQHKLQIIQREKNHIKSSITDLTEAIQKLQNEKIVLRLQSQKEKQQVQAKIKKFQQEKMVNLIEKNKQLERLREVIEQLQEKIKRKQFQLKISEEERKKIEQKSRQAKNEIQKGQQKKLEIIRNLQRQLDQLKRKEGQLKRFKQALKNSQWTTERQIKKSIQNTTKSLANYTSEESKGAILDLMRNLESSIAKLVLVNYQQF